MNAASKIILVVDDDENFNALTCLRLSRDGYQPVGVPDAPAAFASLREQRPALILLDIGLPGMDGWEVCRTLATDATWRDIPIVIFTGKGAREDFDRGRSFPNVCGYFVKPYTAEDVIQHIARVLKAQR